MLMSGAVNAAEFAVRPKEELRTDEMKRSREAAMNETLHWRRLAFKEVGSDQSALGHRFAARPRCFEGLKRVHGRTGN